MANKNGLKDPPCLTPLVVLKILDLIPIDSIWHNIFIITLYVYRSVSVIDIYGFQCIRNEIHTWG